MRPFLPSPASAPTRRLPSRWRRGLRRCASRGHQRFSCVFTSKPASWMARFPPQCGSTAPLRKTIYVEKVPSISERDFASFAPYRAKDGSYGVAFQLDRHGQLTLQNLTMQKNGVNPARNGKRPPGDPVGDRPADQRRGDLHAFRVYRSGDQGAWGVVQVDARRRNGEQVEPGPGFQSAGASAGSNDRTAAMS